MILPYKQDILISLQIEKVDNKIRDEKLFQKVDELESFYSKKVLDAFKKFMVSETDFHGTTGYGYNDTGRDKIDKIFAEVLDSEKALVRSQFISGTHALTVTLFALLRPNDTLLSITGKPYDTLDEVIGIKENPSSLKSYGTIYTDILIPPICTIILDLIRNDNKKENLYYYLENYKKDYEHIFLEKINISNNSFILKGCINQKNINHYTATLLNVEDEKKIYLKKMLNIMMIWIIIILWWILNLMTKLK